MKAEKHQAHSKVNALAEVVKALAIPWRRIALYLTIALGFFLLGFVPMWIKASRAIEQRDAAQRQARLGQLQNTLGTAIVDVQRGEFEPARQTTSEFFTNLRSQVDAGNYSVFTATQRESLKSLLGERDEVITMLARSDPAAADRLSTVYSSYLKLTSNRG